MFTLHNGSVSVDLGNTLVEQFDEAYQAASDDQAEKGLAAFIKPAAIGAAQKLIKPVPLADFDAEMNDDGALQATAWLRARGLRLAPVMMTWQDVDNPDGAHAFVAELQNRKEAIQDELTYPVPLDYWISWVVIGMMAMVLPILLIRQWQKRRTS